MTAIGRNVTHLILMLKILCNAPGGAFLLIMISLLWFTPSLSMAIMPMSERQAVIRLIKPDLQWDAQGQPIDREALFATAIDAIETEVNYPEIPCIYTWLLFKGPFAEGFPTFAWSETIGELTRAYLRSMQIEGKGPEDREQKIKTAQAMGQVLSNMQDERFRQQIIVSLLKSEWKMRPMDIGDTLSPMGPVDYFGRMVAYFALSTLPETLFASVVKTSLDHAHPGVRALATMTILNYHTPFLDIAVMEKLSDSGWVAKTFGDKVPLRTEFLFFLEEGLRYRPLDQEMRLVLRSLDATGNQGIKNIVRQFVQQHPSCHYLLENN